MKINHNSLREQVRELILQRVGSGEYAPGCRIVESRLADELSISAIPIREAIRELATLGVLACSAHKGAWVREISLTDTIQSLQVRSVLEPLAIELAGDRIKKQCAALRTTFESILATAQARDFVGFQRHNQVFHRTVVEASGNTVLIKIWTSLAFEVRTRFIMDFLESKDPVGIAMEHEPIVDALEAGDNERAANLLTAHSNHLVQYLERQIETQENSIKKQTAGEMP